MTARPGLIRAVLCAPACVAVAYVLLFVGMLP
jgi:hypothetical protein